MKNFKTIEGYEGKYEYDAHLGMVWSVKRQTYLKTFSKTYRKNRKYKTNTVTYMGVNLYNEEGIMSFFVLNKVEDGKIIKMYPKK